MFFGLTNSLATFSMMMNNIICDLIVERVICIYLNDILIYTKTLEEHCQIMCIILKHLHQHQLYLKPDKCKFEQTKVKDLSLIISHGTVEMGWCGGVAGTKEQEGSTGLPRLHQLLLEVHSRLLTPCVPLI